MKLKTGTKQWAPCSENCIKGCQNDCLYCYARKGAVRFKQKTVENWHIEEYNPKSAGHMRKHKGRIMFPTSHDLHMQTRDWWLPFLKGLLETGNDVLIVSKPEVAAINTILGSCADYRKQIEFRFTIGSCSEDVLRFWEPHAPSFAERVTALANAKYSEFRTSVSIEPLLDYDPSMLIELIRPFATETIWIGTMNHMHASDFRPEDAVMYHRMTEINSIQNIRAVYALFKHDPIIRWKDSIQKMLGISEEGRFVTREDMMRGME